MITSSTTARTGVELRPLRGLIVLVVLVVLVAACGTRGKVETALARSDDPVLLPAAPFLDNTQFTIYEKWTNQYQLRYNQKIGETSNFTALQFSATSVSETGSEGPGEAQVVAFQAAAGDSNCPVVGEASGLRLCVYEVDSYLVRVFAAAAADGGPITLVASYFDNPAAAAGDDAADRTRYNPDSIEAQVMAGNFTAVAPEAAASTHLTVVS